MAAKQGKRIAVIGGSYDPPHDGHFEVGVKVFEELKIDEVWMVFSVNPFKDPDKYAPFEQRIAMGEIMKKHFPGVPFVMSDIEEQVGVHETWHVLEECRRRQPGDTFIWVMGADSLLRFHEWGNADDIITNYPLAIIDREAYTDVALASITAEKHKHLRAATVAEFNNRAKGWVMLDRIPHTGFSSSDLLNRLRRGETEFPGAFNDVAAYIIAEAAKGNDFYKIRTVPAPHANPAPKL